MKTSLFPIVAATLVLALSAGCRKKEDKPAAEVAVQSPMDVPAEAPAGSEEPAASAAEPSTRVAAPPRKQDEDFLESPAVAKVAADDPAAYEAWFKKNRLDLSDPTMLDADPDGDGFTNRDEFLAGTDPHDPGARPGAHPAIRMKEYSEVRLPLVLESVEGGKARIRRPGASDVEIVKVGDDIRGLPLKVEKVESRHQADKEGVDSDVSRITLEDVSTKERVVLIKDLPARTSASYAVLGSPDGKSTMKVHMGDTFAWPGETGVTYKVIDLSRDQVVLQQVEDKKVWTIPRQ